MSSLGKPRDANGYPRDGIFYPTLTLMMDTDIPLLGVDIGCSVIVAFAGHTHMFFESVQFTERLHVTLSLLVYFVMTAVCI